MKQHQLDQIRNWVIQLAQNSKDPMHGYRHLERVVHNARHIVKKLGIDSGIDWNLLEACCLLHDATYFYKKTGVKTYILEGKIARSIVKHILECININHEERHIILQAVQKHTFSYPFKRLNKKESIYAQILQDADTMEVFKRERYINNGFKAKLLLPIAIIGNHYKHHFFNFPQLIQLHKKKKPNILFRVVITFKDVGISAGSYLVNRIR